MLEITDDGAGLDFAAIRLRARARGLLGPDETVSDAEAVRFIFEPGFSTASAVTQDAGRGVGMDVVATEVKRLGGSLEDAFRRRPGHALRAAPAVDPGDDPGAAGRGRRRHLRRAGERGQRYHQGLPRAAGRPGRLQRHHLHAGPAVPPPGPAGKPPVDRRRRRDADAAHSADRAHRRTGRGHAAGRGDRRQRARQPRDRRQAGRPAGRRHPGHHGGHRAGRRGGDAPARSGRPAPSERGTRTPRRQCGDPIATAAGRFGRGAVAVRRPGFCRRRTGSPP